ncbi:hypothetical protein Ae201684_012877 [Aphanomyces euteiches]|uniref:Uncharacterized protein n=1 Tax=Aphanomyces euteiches TaxID=100861 RepID=A0A6G0WQA9_9STRA|nr:hypothetical protein Ae201684_012877 [Aphanomyces euteiches]
MQSLTFDQAAVRRKRVAHPRERERARRSLNSMINKIGRLSIDVQGTAGEIRRQVLRDGARCVLSSFVPPRSKSAAFVTTLSRMVCPARVDGRRRRGVGAVLRSPAAAAVVAWRRGFQTLVWYAPTDWASARSPADNCSVTGVSA